MAGNRQVQVSTLAVGVVLGIVLIVVLRHLFYIGIGVIIGVLLVAYLARRR